MVTRPDKGDNRDILVVTSLSLDFSTKNHMRSSTLLALMPGRTLEATTEMY